MLKLGGVKLKLVLSGPYYLWEPCRDWGREEITQKEVPRLLSGEADKSTPISTPKRLSVGFEAYTFIQQLSYSWSNPGTVIG
jgi:hypothetical protein